jgi:hypothetical protein
LKESKPEVFFIVALQNNPIAICLKEDGIVKPKRVFNI